LYTGWPIIQEGNRDIITGVRIGISYLKLSAWAKYLKLSGISAIQDCVRQKK